MAGWWTDRRNLTCIDVDFGGERMVFGSHTRPRGAVGKLWGKATRSSHLRDVLRAAIRDHVRCYSRWMRFQMNLGTFGPGR